MQTKFLKPDNPLLLQISQEIPQDQIDSPKTQKIIKTMLKVAYGEQKDSKKPVMVGLAAPQIGILKRIILVDTKADGKGPLRPRSEARKAGSLQVFINPEIIWRSKKEGEWYEGCYSTGEVCGIVSRPVAIKIKAFDLTAKPMGKKFEGYVARIFQHEIDHLDGKVFIDHINDPEKLHLVEKSEFPLYRDKKAWKNWPKKWKKPEKPLA